MIPVGPRGAGGAIFVQQAAQAPTYVDTRVVLAPCRVAVENAFPHNAFDAHAIFLFRLAGLDNSWNTNSLASPHYQSSFTKSSTVMSTVRIMLRKVPRSRVLCIGTVTGFRP